ncbi:uncharacterized protein LOC125240093 [Leguminivora glycinivorella]|uniref:uncharacterized protein LOC125240093 n=1 Tax=Leguminivora glycinivorella TaxID=1035111 RepID=UPI0020101A34|nr:uncharacterized protein LOC125240093 [Leguminivora glycinivorella]
MEELHSCSCCLVRPPERGLRTLYKHLGKTEVYHEMLKDCFDINLGIGNEECGICEVCVGRLRDANDFKMQVKRSQAELQSRFKGVITASDKLKIKLEKAAGEENIIGDIKLEKSEVEMADGEVVSGINSAGLKVSSRKRPLRKRGRGKPVTRWEDEIKNVAGQNWMQIAQERDEWKTLEAFTCEDEVLGR